MDEVTQLLLTRLAGGEQPPGEFSLPDVVEQSLGDDPVAAPLAAMLRRREEQAQASEEAEPDEATDPAVSDVLERLYGELETLRERNRMLADALGACPRCFGEDELCPVCRGRGRPGGRSPNAALFSEVVEPAWRRLEAGDGDEPPVLQVETRET